jgi:hypothetical protein
VEESRYIKELNLCKGEVKLIKRTKGVEKQYRLNCTNCDIAIAYRPVPPELATKYLYVLQDAVSATKVSKRPRTEEQSKEEEAAFVNERVENETKTHASTQVDADKEEGATTE